MNQSPTPHDSAQLSMEKYHRAAQQAHQLSKTLTYMGKPTMARVADAVGDTVSELTADNARLRAALASKEYDAVFMAQVWQAIRASGDVDADGMIESGGDPDGVDFVANRILGKTS